MKQSAGLLLYRTRHDVVEVLLVHPGGPFWAKKDAGAWSIPKGEYEGEDPLSAARREFAEELGVPAPPGKPEDLGNVKQSSAKIVSAWAVEAELDETAIRSNTFEVEWPPKSGTMRAFPEVDKAAWFTFAAAKTKIVPGQLPLLERLAGHLGATFDGPAEPEQASLF